MSLCSDTIRLVQGELVLLHRSGSILVKHWQSSDLPDLLWGHADGCVHEGAVMHLSIVAHLDSVIEY